MLCTPLPTRKRLGFRPIRQLQDRWTFTHVLFLDAVQQHSGRHALREMDVPNLPWLQWAASAGVILNERAAGRYVPTFLGDTLVGESEEIEKSNAAGISSRVVQSVNDALPQSFLDAQKGITSEMWDSTTSPPVSPKMKQWTADGDGSDDDWDDMYSDEEGEEDGKKTDSETKKEGVEESMGDLNLEK